MNTLPLKIMENLASALKLNPGKLELMTAALLAGGHVLLEDVPGTGKSTLAKALARTAGGSFRRIQFTPDLLPADVTGLNVWDPAEKTFLFRPGPVFCEILLADEINRATPRTQSALLECMGENQVTVDGATYPMAKLFFVIATENPVESKGTFPLPEAQLDRFMIRLSLGYPDRSAEEEMARLWLNGSDTPLDRLNPVCSADEVLSARREAEAVAVSPKITNYAVSIVSATRDDAALRLGVSPRGTLHLLRLSQALALMDGRDYVLPDDIKKAAVPVLAHTPLWGISLGFLILSGFLALSLLLFSFSPPGKRFLSESSGIAAWLSEHVFLGMTMLVQLLAMLFGFSYRKVASSHEDRAETGFRATQEAAVREYEFPETLPDDYGQFLRRLARIRSEDAKIGYACRTLCRLYKKVVGNIAPSDTPKEVREKTVRSFPSSDLDTARRIIERVKFAGNPPGEEEKTELLAELCRIVRILI